MHQDTFDQPPGNKLLAYSQHLPQAFSIGSALGIQFHPETANAEAKMEEAEREIADGGYRLFDAWIVGLDG